MMITLQGSRSSKGGCEIRTPEMIGRTHDEKDKGERDGHIHDRTATGTRSLTAFVELSLQELDHGWRVLPAVHVKLHEITVNHGSTLCYGATYVTVMPQTV